MIQQHGRLSVRRDDGVHRHHGRVHGGDVADSHRQSGGSGAHDDVGDLRGVARLPADQRQRELVIVFDQPGRVDHVALRDRIQNVGHRHLGLQQLGRIRLNLKFRDASALQHHRRDAIYTVEARLDGVVGKLPEIALGHGVGSEAVGQNRHERGEGHAIRGELRGGRQ